MQQMSSSAGPGAGNITVTLNGMQEAIDRYNNLAERCPYCPDTHRVEKRFSRIACTHCNTPRSTYVYCIKCEEVIGFSNHLDTTEVTCMKCPFDGRS